MARACFKNEKDCFFLRLSLGDRNKINASKNLNRDTQVTLSRGFARFLDAFLHWPEARSFMIALKFGAKANRWRLFCFECFALEKGLFVAILSPLFAEKLKTREQIVLTRNLTALAAIIRSFLCQHTWLSDFDNLADFVFELTHQRLWTVASSLDEGGKGSNSIKDNSELRLICAKLAKRKLPLLNSTFRQVPRLPFFLAIGP